MNKKLCIGTFLHILTQAKGKATTQEVFLGLLLGLISDYRGSEKTYHQALKSGKNNLSDSGPLASCDRVALIKGFEDIVIPCLADDCKKLIILAIKDVLADDDIGPDTLIGFEDGYTKKDILASVKFNLAETLANVFFYCGTKVNNLECKENIKLVKDTNYIHSFDSLVHTIIFELPHATTSLPLTANTTLFSRTFEEVNCVDLKLPNFNELRSFVLDVVGNDFDYDNIQHFIRSNIGRYVFSRSQRNQYEINGDLESITADAIRAYKKRLEKDSSTTHFNEIMLYLFLEAVLKAPKIYSKMELQNAGGLYESTSAGIHLLMLHTGASVSSQLVFGATDTLDDLREAIDSSFAQIEKIKSKRSDEYNIVESTVMNIVPDYQTARDLEAIILPQKSSVSKPDQAFGIFLGYTVQVEGKGTMPQPAYKQAVKEKMIQDITTLEPYIISKIETLGIKAHSFYIYVLPLNNAGVDKNEIMQKALEV